MDVALIVFFLISLLLGEVTRIQIGPLTIPHVHEVALLILIVYELMQRGKDVIVFVKKEPIAKGIVLFILAGAWSLFVNESKFTSNEIVVSGLYMIRWVVYALLVFIVTHPKSQKIWLWGLYFVGLVFALLGFVQEVFYPYLRNLMYLGWDPHRYRLFSTLLDPNFMGILLVVTFFLGLSLWQQAKFRQHLFIIGNSLLLLAIYLTYSRSAYLGLVVGMAAWLWYQKELGRWRKWGIIGVSVFLLAVILVPRPGGETLRLDRWASTGARIGNWQESVRFFEESPLFGLGFNTLRFVERTNVIFDPNSHAAGGLDNSFLYVLVTSGVVGASVYGYLLYQLTKLSKKLIDTKKTFWYGAGYLAILVSIGVDSMFINSQFYPWVMVYVFVLTGIGIALGHLK